ncbi:hypothetical protein M378DRAFT_162816 [Amanita muscaria Koide BX008]|uniref:Uncharacterized protein n=1 Tax=Amanita muscaria (strain Koide BX008) TaxID=946122 RepID=A0A0C2X7G7_AMAMK|nr:hypothetical protein M378DRAFT_162816 [Amanita muscaria Koide BX008]
MRLSTVFISSAFVLAGMSAALPVERENMLVARFADSDFLAEVEARAYDEEPVLYARGSVVSKESKEHNFGISRPASYRTESSGRPHPHQPSRTDTDFNRPPSPFTLAQQRDRVTDFSGPITHLRSSSRRRSFYETPRDELTRRGFRTWVKNGYSKVTGLLGGSGQPGAAQTMEDSQ